MAEKGGGQFLRRDAAAIVGNADQPHAAAANLHRHGGTSGVNGIFDQFLYHAGGAFHHLAGCDQIGHMGLQLTDVGHRGTSSREFTGLRLGLV